MSKLLQWITRGVLGPAASAGAAEGEDYAAGDEINGDQLAVGDFRLTSSMRFDQAFVETLPACSYDAVLMGAGAETADASALTRAAGG